MAAARLASSFAVAGIFGKASVPRLATGILQQIDVSADDVDRLRAKLTGVAIHYPPLTDEERTKLDASLGVKS